MFHVGQLVECVNGEPASEGGYGDETYPQKGSIYTIRDIYTCRVWGITKVRLHELVQEARRYSDGIYEPGFGADRFRPLSESRLAIFRQMLAPTPEHEPA